MYISYVPHIPNVYVFIAFQTTLNRTGVIFLTASIMLSYMCSFANMGSTTNMIVLQYNFLHIIIYVTLIAFVKYLKYVILNRLQMFIYNYKNTINIHNFIHVHS